MIFVLIALLAYSLVSHNWTNAFCNSAWIFIAYLQLKVEDDYDEQIYLCRYLDELNIELLDILREIAIETQKSEEIDEKIKKAINMAKDNVSKRFDQ